MFYFRWVVSLSVKDIYHQCRTPDAHDFVSVGDLLVTDLEDPLLVVGGDRMRLPNIVPLSNAHIELMLVQLVGPQDFDQVVLMKQVRMVKNPEDINMSLAADYIRR